MQHQQNHVILSYNSRNYDYGLISYETPNDMIKLIKMNNYKILLFRNQSWKIFYFDYNSSVFHKYHPFHPFYKDDSFYQNDIDKKWLKSTKLSSWCSKVRMIRMKIYKIGQIE